MPRYLKLAARRAPGRSPRSVTNFGNSRRRRSLLVASIRGAVDELQGCAIGITEVRPRPIDRAATTFLLEKDLDALGAQRLHRGPVFRCAHHESMVHTIRHLKRAFDDRSRALDQQHA